ncbi:nucleotidyltransferase family protein [Oceanobacillus timonensis]|uniref:nucleotidyltransferase family protein n=1 Tax=Oceanobacillus timonensis TaxID=1926285 RepID=UPI0009B93CF9|nr:nucleotidyltransferase family protein [Oceanobacillus timonensis]
MRASETSIYAIILAAGTSSRMGKPKQLLSFGNNNLLDTVIRLVSSEDFTEILTVIGREAETIQKAITIGDPRFQWVINPNFEKGQSTSLHKAIEHTSGTPINVIIFLGDLPFLKSETIQTVFNVGKKKLQSIREPFVVRPKLKGKVGHPVFLGNIERGWFNQLQGDQGVKLILKQIHNRTEVEVLDEGILFDIDTPEDYEKAVTLLNKKHK